MIRNMYIYTVFIVFWCNNYTQVEVMFVVFSEFVSTPGKLKICLTTMGIEPTTFEMLAISFEN